MGCDIHSIAQVFKNGKWETVLGDVGGDDRNYDSFAIMANVRNGYGFAGVETGEGWPFISEPRGLPVDLKLNDEGDADCPPYRREYQKEDDEPNTTKWLGDHSHSWLLLSEMENFAETVLSKMEYEKTGVVELPMWRALVAEGKNPTCYSGGISGRGLVTVDQEDAAEGVPCTHVQMRWKIKPMEELYTFPRYIEKLREIREKYAVGPNDVRLVFGFDS